VPQSTINLVKNIVGAGMLSLPAGVAAFSGSPKALLPALLFTLVFGLLSAYGFILIADACKRSGETTYQEAWAKLVSPKTKWLPMVACIAKASIGCISFSMILADCLPLILEPLSLPAALVNRFTMLLLVTASVLFPLCSMKSLAPLAKFSVAGVLSNVYICLFVALRAVDGSYRRGGAMLRAAPAAPSFASHSGSAWSTILHPEATVLFSILSTAFLAHYNAPLFFDQLAPGKDGDKSRPFTIVSVLGFGIAAVIFSLVMAGGFMTFGLSSSGLILNNYASTDWLAEGARAAIALSLITAYPLVFFSLRKQVVGALGKRGADFAASRPGRLDVMLLGAVTLVALCLNDLGKVASFAGACFGTFLIYVAPALMVLRAQQRGIGPRPGGLSGKLGRATQFLLIPLGLALAVVGVYESLI